MMGEVCNTIIAVVLVEIKAWMDLIWHETLNLVMFRWLNADYCADIDGVSVLFDSN